MYGNTEDSFGPTLVSALIGTTAGYLDGSWVKKKPGSMWPTITRAIVGIGGLGTRNMFSRPYTSAILEGLGYGGLYGTGMAIAANTTTIGGVAPGALQMNRTSTTSFVRGRGVGAAVLPPRVIQPQAFVPGYDYSFGYEASA